MSSSRLYSLYEHQYSGGKWSGPQWYQHLHSFIKNREAVIAELVPNNQQTLLDLGCGEGTLMKMCVGKVEKLTGVDLLESRLAKAKQKYAKEVHAKKFTFHAHDLNEKLPFSDASFETVICSSAIEYTFDPIFVVDEVHRVLQKDGTFIIEVPNLAFLLERLRLLNGKLVGVAHASGWQGGRLHHFTFSTLRKLLEEHGFSVVQKSSSGLFARGRNIWPELLAADIILVAKKV